MTESDGVGTENDCSCHCHSLSATSTGSFVRAWEYKRTETKLNFKVNLQPTMPALKLICIFFPDEDPKLKKLFSVSIDDDQIVDDLKKAIKHEKANLLKDIDADELTLYKVSIPKGQLKQALQDLDPDNGEISAPELDDPLLTLLEVFPDVKSGHLHVIVRTPETLGSTCYTPSNYFYISPID